MELTGAQRTELVVLVKDGSVCPEIARRAQMIIWESDGMAIGKIATLARVSRPTLNLWRRRYREEGIAGLSDRKRPGRPPRISSELRNTILSLTCKPPPEDLGISRWSSRGMAAYLKKNHGVVVSYKFISELWREHGLNRPYERVGRNSVCADPSLT